jgi:membrane protease YdiL (CAAX protease family)
MKNKESKPVENTLTGTAIQRFSLARPILMCIILFIIAVFFRWIDNFVLRLDELLGELILTKSLGFVLVLVWLWFTGRKVKDIGLHSNKVGQILLIGTFTTVVAFILGYLVEFLLALQQGTQPAFQLAAIDPKMGVEGGMLFALWMLGCNFVNSFMEEGLFRGVMGRLARIRFTFWQTIWFTAFMFGIWHLPWVLKYYQLGQIKTGGEIAMAVLFNSVPQFIIGIVYGYYYLKTSNLWGPWLLHTLSNSIGNFLHVTTTGGMDTGMPIRMTIYMVVMLISLYWVRHMARTHQMPELKPWE